MGTRWKDYAGGFRRPALLLANGYGEGRDALHHDP